MTKPKPKDRKYRAGNLETRGGEVDRASFQMVNHVISVLFFHFKNGSVHTFQMETMHGKVLAHNEDTRGSFKLWVARSIKELMSEKVPV